MLLRRGVLQLGRRQIGLGHQSAVAVTSNHLLNQRAPAAASSVFKAWFSSYPSHEVVGLPALSPVGLVLSCPGWYSLSIYIYCIFYSFTFTFGKCKMISHPNEFMKPQCSCYFMIIYYIIPYHIIYWSIDRSNRRRWRREPLPVGTWVRVIVSDPGMLSVV